jgi:hypothetical protein
MAKRASDEREYFWWDLIGRHPSSGLAIAPFDARSVKTLMIAEDLAKFFSRIADWC